MLLFLFIGIGGTGWGVGIFVGILGVGHFCLTLFFCLTVFVLQHIKYIYNYNYIYYYENESIQTKPKQHIGYKHTQRNQVPAFVGSR